MSTAPEPPPDPTIPNPGSAVFAADPRWWRPMFPLLFAATIFLASGRSSVGTGPLPAGGDKVVHFAAFGLLATATCRLGRGWKSAFWALLAVSAYGAIDEWHQSFVPMRQSDLMDWIADTLGAAAGVITYQGWPRYRQWLEFRLGRRIRRPKTGLNAGSR